MINDITIAILIGVTFVIVGFSVFVMGQYSAWKFLRKKGEVTMDGWRYTAIQVNADGSEVKKWK